MDCYHAEVINISLNNDKILRNFPILDVKKRFLGFVKIYTVAVPEINIDETIKLFQENMGTRLKKEWYITFHNAEYVIIVFRKRIFKLSGKGIKPIYKKILDISNAEERDKWNEVIRYAKSLGIPDEQCDFLPEGFDERIY